MAALDSSMGAMLIGVILAGIMYGVTCSQVFYYFTHYPRDHWATKLLVTAVWLCDTTHQGLISYTIYWYLVTQYGNPEALGIPEKSIIIEVFFSSFIGLFVQSFFTLRIWRLSGKARMIVIPVILLVGGEFILTTAYAIMSLSLDTFEEVNRYEDLSIAVNSIAAAGDIVIAAILCVILHKSRTGFRKSNILINKLMIFAVNTGALTSICATLTFISVLASPNTFIYITFFFFMGRLYANSLMATLNARNSIRDGTAGDTTWSLQDMQPSVMPAGSIATRRTGDIAIRIDTTSHSKHDVESQYGGTTKSPIEEV
ncbi:hypothetical protein C2E23DRAFT_615472 [Lenzites betulinus]|nr:hypothetical protein C2E23DRAFT_615472 [Lenzites betulinus]